jgi:signal transduction histidine kinase
VQLVLFRVIQESINNIIKHSRAKNVKITFEKTGSDVTIQIMDNGVGFVMDPNKTNSLGLSTIRERIKSINGLFSIKSKPGEGTQTTLIVPISGIQG